MLPMHLGLAVPKKPEQPMNHSIPADGVAVKFQPKPKDQGTGKIQGPEHGQYD